jgi:hypothetical protein
MDVFDTAQPAGFWREQLTFVGLTVTDSAVPAVGPKETCSGDAQCHRVDGKEDVARHNTSRPTQADRDSMHVSENVQLACSGGTVAALGVRRA